MPLNTFANRADPDQAALVRAAWSGFTLFASGNMIRYYPTLVVREPVIGLIKWLRPKGLKVFSYVEKCAEFKNQTLKKSAGTQKCYAHGIPPGYALSQNSAKMGVPLQVYTLNHIKSEV